MQPDVALSVARYIAEYRTLVVNDALAVLSNPHVRELAVIAHRLAGTLASFGLAEAALLARRLERAARPDPAGVSSDASPDDIEHADLATRDALAALRRSLESST